MNRHYDDERTDDRDATAEHEEHDNGYVEGCDECAQDELEAEEAAADSRLDALVALFMVDPMLPSERAAALSVPPAGPKFFGGGGK